jgi:organic hydroperoxide reductase OsmC/OhrA
MPTLRSNDAHEYRALLTWTGNTGSGTATYDGYGRSYRIAITGKPELQMSADAAFRGDASAYNPEDLFLAAISGCHMLSYLALCARRGVSVVAYEDHSSGVLRLKGGGGAFEQVTIAPVVTIADGRHASLAAELHDRAAECCFIANSCRVPIHHRPTIRVQEALHV